jgi:hypothetical protein
LRPAEADEASGIRIKEFVKNIMAAGPTKRPEDSKSRDYGIGPEPKRYSFQWMEWIETRALLAALDGLTDERKPKENSDQPTNPEGRELQDYGLGPEPKRYTPEWEEWIESRDMIEGLMEVAAEKHQDQNPAKSEGPVRVNLKAE